MKNKTEVLNIINELIEWYPKDIRLRKLIVMLNESDDTMVKTNIDKLNTDILIIDDDVNATDLLSYVLSKNGFSVVVCNSSLKAFDVFKEVQPALIILDLMMPEVSGREILNRIRKEGFKDVKIIISSSKNYETDRVSAIQEGADDFIPKPYSIKEIPIRIKKLLMR